MNKKNIILFTVLLAGVGLWWKSRPDTSSENISVYSGSSNGATSTAKASAILARDKEKLERNLKPETLNDKNWPQINDYTLSAKRLVNKNNASELFKLTQTSAKDLAACLRKDFCGMQRRNDQDAYFDDQKTPGHILLGRNLEIMLESLHQNSDLKKELDWDLIRDLTDNENEKVQLLAIEMIKDYDVSGSDTENLLSIAEKFKGNAKAGALEKIASKSLSSNSLNDRILLINSLEKSFAQDDPNTVISVVEKLNKMHLSKDELAKVSRNLCRFKENGSDDPNWKMIKYDMGKLSDLDSICN